MCVILPKNLALSCQCPANLSGSEFNDNGLIDWAEAISRQENSQAGAEHAAVIVKEITTLKRTPLHLTGTIGKVS